MTRKDVLETRLGYSFAKDVLSGVDTLDDGKKKKGKRAKRDDEDEFSPAKKKIKKE